MIIIKKQYILSLIFIVGILFSLTLLTHNLYAKKTKDTFYIYIDPGHGGYDGGCSSKDNKIIEKDVTLNISKILVSYLRTNGYIVKLTRENDKAIAHTKKEDMHKRVKMINESKANLYISIHVNSYPSPNVKGTQIFYNKNNEENKKISNIIMKNIKLMDPTNNKTPLYIKNKYLVDNATTPGCLIELGFLTNEEDLNKLSNNLYLTDLARTIYIGIIEYLDYLK